MTRLFADLRLPEVSERLTASSTVVLPIGATEQHGPHLPMAVDTIIAQAISTAVVDRIGDELDVWLLPTLAVSKSNEHIDLASLSLSVSTMHAVLSDIAGGLVHLGVRRLVLLNAHGGNTTLLGTALRELRVSHGLLTFLVHPFVPPAYGGTSNEHELGMGIHGGHDETSLMLHLRPDLVAMDAATRSVPKAMAENTFVKFGGPTSFGWLASDLSSEGHIGDPTGATAAIGATLFDQAVGLLSEQMREIVTFEFPNARSTVPNAALTKTTLPKTRP